MIFPWFPQNQTFLWFQAISMSISPRLAGVPLVSDFREPSKMVVFPFGFRETHQKQGGLKERDAQKLVLPFYRSTWSVVDISARFTCCEGVVDADRMLQVNQPCTTK